MNNNYVLIRGLVRGNGHWGDFPKLLESVDPGCQIECYEIPGNGTRNSEVSPTNPVDIITDFRSRSEFCKRKESFTLCGVSLGGMLALKWVELYPADVQRTVVVNSSLNSLSAFYDRLETKNYFKILNILTTVRPEEKEKKILELTSNQSPMDPALEQKMIDFSKRFPVRNINFVRQLILARNIQVSSQLKSPIYVVQSVTDRLVNSRCSAELANYLKAKLISHPTAGHDLPLDDAKWLAEFLKNVN